MKTRQDFLTVRDLVELRKNDMMAPNPEYQRGAVWTQDQQKKLIDSVLRGYQLPIIYLHDIKRTIAGRTQERYDIIDGQQRISALRLFVEGAFTLYDVKDERARFPKFLWDFPCPWGNKDFDGLPEDLQTQLLDTNLPVTFIEPDVDHEVRDLFVRLQSGFPLNAQEKRDSYPGEFTDFILKLGGKPEIPRYPGHDFFQRVLRMKPSQDRGKTRQLAAQIAILFLERRSRAGDYYTDINARAIDDYYYTHLDFDSDTPECLRLRSILDKLDSLLGDGKRKLAAHNAIHLVLLLDSLWDDYTRSWESTLAGAQDEFSALLAKGAAASKEGKTDETWLQYGVWTRTNSDRGDSIHRRHVYYANQMAKLMGNLAPKDSTRAFGALEREIIYSRDRKLCSVCEAEVTWADAEIHHIDEHSKGGKTVLENGVLVHKHCHPKGKAAEEFAKKL